MLLQGTVPIGDPPTDGTLRVAVVCSLTDTNERDLIRALAAVDGVEPVVVTGSRNYDDLAVLEQRRIYHTEPASRLLALCSAVRPFDGHRSARLLDEIDPDVVMALGASRLWFLPAISGFTPTVFLPQGFETDRAIGELWGDGIDKLRYLGYRLLFSRLLDRVSEVWTHASARPVYESLGLPPSGFVEFDWGPVDTETFAPAADPVRYADDDTLVVGTFRRMRELEMLRPSYETLLGGVARLVEDGRDVHLVVGGYGFVENDVEAFVDDRIRSLDLEEHVTRLDIVPKADIPRYYAGLDVYLNPTYAGTAVGGIGTGSKEAMACGCALLTTNDPPMDYLIDHRENGLLIDHGDAAAVERELARLDDDRTALDALSTAARETVVDRFSLTAIGERMRRRCRRLTEDS